MCYKENKHVVLGCFICFVNYKHLEYCLIHCMSSTYFWPCVHPQWSNTFMEGYVIKGLWQRYGQNSGSKCDDEVLMWAVALRKRLSNSSWAKVPQLFSPRTCHLLLGQNIGQTQPQAEGKGAWLIMSVEVSLQGHRQGRKGEEWDGKSSPSRSRRTSTRDQVCSH